MLNKTKRWLFSYDNGGLSVLSFALIFAMLIFFSVLMNLSAFYLNYVLTESKIQSSITSAVEYAMLDDNRAIKVLKCDTVVAQNKAYEFLYADLGLDTNGVHYGTDGKRVYTVSINSFDVTAQPPSITMSGEVDYVFPLSFMGTPISQSIDFTVTSHNVSLRDN